MTTRLIAAITLLTLLAPLPAQAVETTLQLQLNADQDFDRRTITYDCGTAVEPLVVTYLNVAPNFIAVVPVPDETQPLVFASVISASGVRYAAGRWIWTTQGIDASLFDAETGEADDPTLTCSELINTP